MSARFSTAFPTSPNAHSGQVSSQKEVLPAEDQKTAEIFTRFATGQKPKEVFRPFYPTPNLREITPLEDPPAQKSLLSRSLNLGDINNRAQSLIFLSLVLAGFSTVKQLNWSLADHMEKYGASFNLANIASNIGFPLFYEMIQSGIGISRTAAGTLLALALFKYNSVEMPDAVKSLGWRSLGYYVKKYLLPLIVSRSPQNLDARPLFSSLFSGSGFINRARTTLKCSLFSSWFNNSDLSLGKFNDNLNHWTNWKYIAGLSLALPAIADLSARVLRAPKFQEELITGKVESAWSAFLSLPRQQATSRRCEISVLATFAQKGRTFSLPFTVAPRGQKGNFDYRILGKAKNIEEYLSSAVQKEFGNSADPISFRMRLFVQKK